MSFPLYHSIHNSIFDMNPFLKKKMLNIIPLITVIIFLIPYCSSSTCPASSSDSNAIVTEQCTLLRLKFIKNILIYILVVFQLLQLLEPME